MLKVEFPEAVGLEYETITRNNRERGVIKIGVFEIRNASEGQFIGSQGQIAILHHIDQIITLTDIDIGPIEPKGTYRISSEAKRKADVPADIHTNIVAADGEGYFVVVYLDDRKLPALKIPLERAILVQKLKQEISRLQAELEEKNINALKEQITTLQGELYAKEGKLKELHSQFDSERRDIGKRHESTLAEKDRQMKELAARIPQTGILDISTDPPGASIEINGRAYGKTNSIVRDLMEGRHLLKLEKAEHLTHTEEIEIRPEQTTFRHIELKRLPLLQVKGLPVDATIRLAKEVGKTQAEPVRIPIPVEEPDKPVQYILIVEKEDYERFEEAVTLEVDKVVDKHVYLKPLTASEAVAISKSIEQAVVETLTIDGKEYPIEIVSERDNAKMRLIPSGEFLMGMQETNGTTDCSPVHPVFLDAFYIDKYAVTNEQYALFLNDVQNEQSDEGYLYLDLDSPTCLIEKEGEVYRAKAGYENYPVIEVSWYGARDYAQWAGKRLPTEAEWEKAARGGLEGKQYPWGNEPPEGKANFGNSRAEASVALPLKPVDSYEPNGYGLYNISANIWEWCADWYQEDYYKNSPKEKPANLTSDSIISDSRVVRGGAWDEPAETLRCAYRRACFPYVTSCAVGFRCARDINTRRIQNVKWTTSN